MNAHFSKPERVISEIFADLASFARGISVSVFNLWQWAGRALVGGQDDHPTRDGIWNSGCLVLTMAFIFGWMDIATAIGIEKISLSPAKEMNRADLYYCKIQEHPRAVLVLAPGCNSSGEELIRQSQWQTFARKEGLGLVGLSFASDVALLKAGSGYYYAGQGSGELLLDGLREIFGTDMALLLFGFSGGAHFVSRFTEWKPDQVLSWFAYSAWWWDEPKASKISPPGIVACGDEDSRYGASLTYFKQGRAIGKPWLWIGVGATGHTCSEKMGTFARNYFSAVLRQLNHLKTEQQGKWVDIDRENVVNPTEEHPTLIGWLPDERLLNEWSKLNES